MGKSNEEDVEIVRRILLFLSAHLWLAYWLFGANTKDITGTFEALLVLAIVFVPYTCMLYNAVKKE